MTVAKIQHFSSTHDTRDFITSLDPSDVTPSGLQKLVRDHWQIENSLHFVKDRLWERNLMENSEGRSLGKLKVFEFNHIRWQYREFAYDEIFGKKPKPRMFSHFSMTPFARDWLDLREECEKNLLGMIDVTGNVFQLLDHFVDAAGIAWPVGSYVVVPAEPDPETCIVVAPKR